MRSRDARACGLDAPPVRVGSESGGGGLNTTLRDFAGFGEVLRLGGRFNGQVVCIDPRAQMTIVRYASYPAAANAFNDPLSLPAYRALAEWLMQND